MSVQSGSCYECIGIVPTQVFISEYTLWVIVYIAVAGAWARGYFSLFCSLDNMIQIA